MKNYTKPSTYDFVKIFRYVKNMRISYMMIFG